MIAWIALFIISLFMLLYIYGGYAVFITFIAYVFGDKQIVYDELGDERLPKISVFLSALNEEDVIEKRLENIISGDYPQNNYEIIVVSDGSTDKTAEIVRSIGNAYQLPVIRCIEFLDNLGPAAAQNEVVLQATYDILVSTDARTEFLDNTLRVLISSFQMHDVGAAGGRIIYQKNDTALGEGYGRYRDMENKIRLAESKLAVGVKVDGPLAAFRREIWQPIEEFEDVDQVAPMLARKQNYKTVYVPNAIAIDEANANYRQELNQRTRMTRKAWLSFVNRWSFLDSIKYPFFTFALLSHKYIRFLSPLFILGLVLSIIFISTYLEIIEEVFVSSVIVSVLLWAATFFQKTKKYVELLVSFGAANLAFLKGGWLALRKEQVGKYVPTCKIDS